VFYPAVPRPNHRRPADNGSCVPACIGKARRTRCSTMQRRHRGEEDAEHVLSTRAGCRICRRLIFFAGSTPLTACAERTTSSVPRRQCRGWKRTSEARSNERTQPGSNRLCAEPFLLLWSRSIIVANTTNHPGPAGHQRTNRECTCGRPGCITGVRVAAIQAEGRRTRLSSVNRS
jgi:hypothetical protein